MKLPIHLPTLRSSQAYCFAKSLLGSAQRSDDLLSDLEWKIATQPESFPIVELPGTRVATTTLNHDGQRITLAVFFYQVDSAHLEMTHLCVERHPKVTAHPLLTRTQLPLAA